MQFNRQSYGQMAFEKMTFVIAYAMKLFNQGLPWAPKYLRNTSRYVPDHKTNFQKITKMLIGMHQRRTKTYQEQNGKRRTKTYPEHIGKDVPGRTKKQM